MAANVDTFDTPNLTAAHSYLCKATALAVRTTAFPPIRIGALYVGHGEDFPVACFSFDKLVRALHALAHRGPFIKFDVSYIVQVFF